MSVGVIALLDDATLELRDDLRRLQSFHQKPSTPAGPI